MKIKGSETSWMNSVYVAGKIIEKIWTIYIKKVILLINMLLKKLINHLPAEKKNIKIHGLSTNSKKIQKGFIFFAINGRKFNGERFIDEAILNGASVIICSKNCKYRSKSALIIKKLNVRHFLSEVSSKYYKLKPNNIIAVGDKQETSVADLFYQILKLIRLIPILVYSQI